MTTSIAGAEVRIDPAIEGMVPSAMAFGVGCEFRAPMAVAVIAGLIVSTLLSLVFALAVFLLIDSLGNLLGRVLGRFHMTAFAAFMTAGLALVPAGRAIVLGYTTPLWVAPAAFLFLGERISTRQTVGLVVGLAGLLLLFGPASLDWGNRQALLGQGLLLVAALCWSVSIVYTRAHRWVATPLQLMPWQCLLAAVVLTTLAFLIEGAPPDPGRVSTPALLALGYNGVVGTALGFWAMTVVGRRVPAATASLGVLATPVLGIGLSTVILREAFDPILVLAAAIILTGIALGTIGQGRVAQRLR
ncbi:hypothetical protein AO398_25155 [Methylobacterium sp. GXS13]|uniref:DMT family transporter n=1 Tax=Methylobacterium sp. GXS13 TaxID=1730094 RepID=UPI00071B2132|nr:DMT family transporter [Methylobacterium sp. GXS13]KST57331.1 hypothetical protein AO398_25155 [Methylobacterium sp. GXS13]